MYIENNLTYFMTSRQVREMHPRLSRAIDQPPPRAIVLCGSWPQAQ